MSKTSSNSSWTRCNFMTCSMVQELNKNSFWNSAENYQLGDWILVVSAARLLASMNSSIKHVHNNSQFKLSLVTIKLWSLCWSNWSTTGRKSTRSEANHKSLESQVARGKKNLKTSVLQFRFSSVDSKLQSHAMEIYENKAIKMEVGILLINFLWFLLH